MIKSQSEQKYRPKVNNLSLDIDCTKKKPLVPKTANTLFTKHEDKSQEEYLPHPMSKTLSLKSQILRIPKARQLLNMDKHIYIQDVEKRIELLGDIKEENYQPALMNNLQTLCKPVEKKKTRRHKTSFKIPLTRNNLNKMNGIIQQHIDVNRKFKNKEVVLLKEYEKTAPFNLEALRFIDDLNEVNQLYKKKFEYDKGNLSKNKLTLQHVILNRNVKRELKLDKNKEAKQHAKNIIANL